MIPLEQIQSFFQNDRFAAGMGIEIVSAQPDESLCRMTIREDHLNAGNVVQGGAIFTLADFAFAVAANASGRRTVSLSNTISYLAVPKGKLLFARAKLVHSTKRVCFFEVSVTDEEGTVVALMQANGYIKDIAFDLAPV